MYIPNIMTNNSITVIIDTPKSIDDSHPNFAVVRDMLTKGTVKTAEGLLELMEPVREYKRAIRDSEFTVGEFGEVYLEIDGHPFPLIAELGDEVLRIYRASGDLSPLTNFIKKLAANPDKDVHQQLYGFIQVCGLALTMDGDFLAYKNIREDFKDIYTGTMDNSPGTLVQMPRFAVEKNPDKTCSAGLHFAAWGYLQHYGSGRKTVIVKINPADVVSIPSDYNNMKGRASQYLILKEVEQPEELKYRPVFDYVGSDLEDFDWDDSDEYDKDDDADDYDDDEEETYQFQALTSFQISVLETQGYSQEEIEELDQQIIGFLEG